MGGGTGSGRRGGGGWVCGGLVVAAVFLALAFFPVGMVHAAGLSVTNCNGTGAGSLVDAITTANTNADTSNTITFAQDCSATPITFTSTQTISKTLMIDGTGHMVTISGGNAVRLFAVNSGVTFAVSGLTLIGGNGGVGNGGAIFNNNNGTVTVTNSTLSGNSTTSGGGGGIFNNFGMVTLTNSTLSNNSSGGGIFNGGTLNVTNTLIVNNSGGDVAANGINGTNTHNLTGPFTFATALQNNGGSTATLAIPTSGPAYQQGDLPTCNAIAPVGTPAGVYDQRGAPRVVGGTCSIGAYEPGLVTTTTVLTATATSAAFGTPVTFTATVRGVLGGTPPDGTNVVTFKNGTITLGTATLVSGTATLTTSTLPPGTSVTATYTAGGMGNPYAASPASNAVAVTITPLACVVTSTLDPSESGKLTLRDAINAANAGACTGNAITFDATAFPAATAKTITLGDTLMLSHDVTIDGTGHTVVIDGGCSTDANSDCTGGGNTVFLLSGGNVTTLRALTIQHGNGGLGGGMYLNAGTLTVTNSTLTHNTAGYYGGGIFNAGTLTVTNSTFANNAAPTTGGGGIFSYLGTVTVTNSTFANNSASRGGGIFNNDTVTVTVTNSTFANNSATNGGGIWNDGGTLTVTNTILAGNPGGDVRNNSGTISGSGHNLVGTSSGYTFTAPGDTTGPALLAPLGNYGGTTRTFALLPGSAALGGGDVTTCAAALPAGAGGVDQRGVIRPDAGTTACDIGAFESQGFTLAKTGGDAQSIVFGSPTPFAPLAATVTSKDAGVTVNGSSLTFVIVPGTSSATFGAAGSTGCTVSLDKLTASGCPVNGSGVATSPPFAGTVPGGFTVTASATPGDAPEATYTETVTKATPTVSVTSSANPSVVGTSVTFTATVSGIAGTIPTGTVQFASIPTGSTTSTPLGAPVALDGSGQAAFATSTLSVGLHHLTATYTPASPGPYTTSQGTQDVTITAAALVSIAVTPVNGTVKVGQAQQFSATGTYANNTTADLTNQVTWSSDAAAIAGVDTGGKGTGQSPGSAHIRATQGTISGQTAVTVSAPTLTGVAPAPAPASRPAGTTSEPVATPAPAPSGRSGTTGGAVPVSAPSGR